MRTHLALALCLLTACRRIGATTQIVAFGDSLTDDCTHGTKQIIDAALNTTAVSTAALSYHHCAVSWHA